MISEEKTDLIKIAHLPENVIGVYQDDKNNKQLHLLTSKLDMYTFNTKAKYLGRRHDFKYACKVLKIPDVV